MLACVDVDYRGRGAMAACLVFQNWGDSVPVKRYTNFIGEVEEYKSGEFYRREMPPLLEVLKSVRENLSTIIIDGYVWLNSSYYPGMGAHLYRALKDGISVVGVAKSSRGQDGFSCEVLRGESRNPLYVTSVGVGSGHASDCIKNMHGSYRLPTLLKSVDRLCRDS